MPRNGPNCKSSDRPVQLKPILELMVKRVTPVFASALVGAKRAVNSATKPLAEGLQDESYLFQQLIRTESGRRNMEKFLKTGGQTREGELRIDELNKKLGEP